MYVVRGFESVDYLRLKIRVGNEQVLPAKGQAHKAVRGRHNQGVVGWAINNLLWRASKAHAESNRPRARVMLLCVMII